MAACVNRRTVRLGTRSATTPAIGENSRTGSSWRPVVMPSAVPLWVSCRISQSCATRCIHVPMLETKAPIA